MYGSHGTSMVVAAATGLGDAQTADWTSILNQGIQTVTGIYTAEQSRKDLEREREFQIRMAKINSERAINQITQGGSGETTQDGMRGSNVTTIALVGGGILLVGGALYFGLKKKKRR